MDMNKEDALKKSASGMNAEEEIKKLIMEYNKAILDQDIEKLMSFYANDVIAFDMIPPIQFDGKSAYRESWENAFKMTPKEATKENSGYDIHNLTVYADEHLAFAHSINHCYGPMSDGKTMDMWARGTQCFKKMDNKWYIVHEQYSLPVDFESGKALMNLRPDNLFN